MVIACKGPLEPPRRVQVEIPMPPSLNNCFPTSKSGHRYPSEDYKAWQESAGYALKAQRPHSITVPCAVTLTMKEPKHRCDLDNRIKPVLDLIVKHSVIPDDDSRFVRSITARFGEVAGVL